MHAHFVRPHQVCLVLGLLIFGGATASARTFHVATWGDDDRQDWQAENVSTPWRTIQRAVDVAYGGDTVIVADGRYRENVTFRRSGYSGGEINLRAEAKFGAAIDGYIFGEFVDHVRVDGFDVTNASRIPPTKGIMFVSGHHLTVRDCRVHDCFGGGISFNKCDWVLCEWNITYGNAFYTDNSESGISVFQPEYRGNDSRQYGHIIRNNTSYGNYNFVAHPTFGFITDGHGIILDDFRHRQDGGQPYDRPTLVENNIVSSNGGSGIHVYSSLNIRVRNNTVVSNLGNLPYGGEITVDDCDRIYVYNNIAWARPGRASLLGYQSNQVISFNNIVLTPPQGMGNVGGLLTDPQFIPGTFELGPGSPALNSAYNNGDHFELDAFGRARINIRLDIGALER